MLHCSIRHLPALMMSWRLKLPLCVQLHFADDSQEQPVEIYHKLKLYDEADPNNPSAKKPVRH